MRRAEIHMLGRLAGLLEERDSGCCSETMKEPYRDLIQERSLRLGSHG